MKTLTKAYLISIFAAFTISVGSAQVLFAPSPIGTISGTNVGVGINAPTFRLQVNTSAANDGIRVLQTGASSAALRLDNSYTGGRNWGVLSTSSGNSQGGGKLLFYDYSSTVTGSRERMILDGVGNLGIGVNSVYSFTPQTRLHIHDGSLKFTGTDPVNGAPNIFWGGTPSSAPSGEWALEYNTNLYGYAGLNFWRPNQSHDASGTAQTTVNSVLFLGNNNCVGIKTNNTTKAAFTVNGNVLIGDPATVNTNTTFAYGLYVQNGILTSKVRVAVVNGTNWADYVFAPGYQLPSLDSVKSYVLSNQHLEGVPSSSDVKKDGVDLLEMNIILLKKIEEMTLYMFQQEERIKTLEAATATDCNTRGK